MVEDFTKWCDNAYLQQNASETKDMSIDFRAATHSSQTTLTRDENVECVEKISNIWGP